jgi:homoserine dehydrogenase
MRTIRIGMIGVGTVGGAAYRILRGQRKRLEARIGSRLEVSRVVDKNPEAAASLKIPARAFTSDAADVLGDQSIDIVVELIGGLEPARTFITEALKGGKTVVTANKEVMARSGAELVALARAHDSGLYFEASVGGGIPLLRGIHQGLAGNRLSEIYGIVNGTTNYILTKMSTEGMEFNEALEEAREMGYAEADPSYDIDGLDAAHKIAILASIAFGRWITVDMVHREGIRGISQRDISYVADLGYAIKLLAISKASRRGTEVRVHPTLIPQTHLLASVRDNFNAIFVNTDSAGPGLFYGTGAGGPSAGSAVVADILDASRSILSNSGTGFESGLPTVKAEAVASIGELRTRYYIRLRVVDRPGALAKISGVFGEEEISLASVRQIEERGKVVDLVFMTHEAVENNVRRGLDRIADLEVVRKVSSCIRVEDSI